jgi:5-methylcytosine-specific restriction protein B
VEGLIEVLQRLKRADRRIRTITSASPSSCTGINRPLEDIWRMEIEPYLEEYFFDRPEKARAFRWEEIRLEVES